MDPRGVRQESQADTDLSHRQDSCGHTTLPTELAERWAPYPEVFPAANCDSRPGLPAKGRGGPFTTRNSTFAIHSSLFVIRHSLRARSDTRSGPITRHVILLDVRGTIGAQKERPSPTQKKVDESDRNFRPGAAKNAVSHEETNPIKPDA